MASAADEAAEMKRLGGNGFYFRTFRQMPRELSPGSRIFYVEDGYIRGYGLVKSITTVNAICSTTGTVWGEGFHAIMPAKSWTWIAPILMKGFQGWKYFDAPDIKIVGGWKDPKPKEG